MKKSKIIILVAFVVMALFTAIGSAQASCGQYGYVVRVLSYPGDTANNYIYIAPTALATSYYYVRTADPKIASAAYAATTSRTRVLVYGNAASCPTTGTYRYMGFPLYSTYLHDSCCGFLGNSALLAKIWLRLFRFSGRR